MSVLLSQNIPSESELPFANNRQLALLGYIINNTAFYERIRSIVKPTWFQDLNARKLLKAVDDYMKEYGCLPKSSQDLVTSNTFMRNPNDDRVRIAACYKTCMEHHKSFSVASLDRDMQAWMQYVYLKEMMAKAGKEFKKRDLVKSAQIIANEIKGFFDIQFDAGYEETLASPVEIFKAGIEAREGACTFGDPLLDRMIDDTCAGGSLLAGQTTAILAPMNIGKCLGRGTKVIRFDGQIANVEDIKTGDLLMGPDGKPRKVLSTTSGIGPLFKITPNTGASSWVCNDAHILNLKAAYSSNTQTAGDTTNISMIDYLKKSKDWKNRNKMWRASLEFEEKQLDVPPYILGLWLGDGTSKSAQFTSMDGELAEKWMSWIKTNEDSIGIRKQKNNKSTMYTAKLSNGLKMNRLKIQINSKRALKDIGVLDNKHIPLRYLTSSREQRLELLAGIIDTDGHLSTSSNHYQVMQKNKRLAYDIAYLARSLGFKVTEKEVHKSSQNGTVGSYIDVSIYGMLSTIPVQLLHKKGKDGIKNTSTYGFEVEPIGNGEYFGFCLDQDHLFLLGDFTVTHNTSTMINIALANIRKGKRVLFIPLEGSSQELKEKIWASYLGESKGLLQSKVKQGVIPDNLLTLWNGHSAHLKNFLTYMPVIESGLTLQKLVPMIQMKQQEMLSKTEHGYDMILVDYPAILMNDNFKNGGDATMRGRIDNNYRTFCQLAGEIKTHCVLAIQTNREAAKDSKGLQRSRGKRLVVPEDVAESYDPVRNVDNLITINRDSDAQRHGYMTLYIGKNRSGEVNKAYLTKTDFARTRTHGEDLPSCWYYGNIALEPEQALKALSNTHTFENGKISEDILLSRNI